MSINKKAYNDEMQERGSYALIPNEIWERQDLDHTSKLIWCYILSRKSDWKSSRNNIARNLKMSVNTVTQYINELQNLNLLKIHRGPQNSWDFEIVPPSHWLADASDTNLAQYTGRSNSESKMIQITGRSSTESLADLVVNQPVIHTQEDNKARIAIDPTEEFSFSSEEQSHDQLINQSQCEPKESMSIAIPNEGIPSSDTAQKELLSTMLSLANEYPHMLNKFELEFVAGKTPSTKLSEKQLAVAIRILKKFANSSVDEAPKVAPTTNTSNYTVGDRNEDGSLKVPPIDFYANAISYGEK